MVIPKGFFPQQDTGLITGITEAAADVSPDQMANLQRAVIDVIAKDPAVSNATGYIGPGGPTVTENNGRLFILLKPRDQRDANADQIIRRLDKQLQKLQGVSVFMQATQDINLASRLSKTQVPVYAHRRDPRTNLIDGHRDFMRNCVACRNSLMSQPTRPMQVVSLNCRSIAMPPRVSVSIPPPSTTRFTTRLASGTWRSCSPRSTATMSFWKWIHHSSSAPMRMNRIYVRSPSGAMVPLGQFTKVETGIAPLAVNHQSQFPSVTLSFNLAPGAAVGTAISAIQNATTALHMPGTVTASFQGNAQAFQSSLKSTPVLIVAALIAVYLILGMLYESIVHPITILSTLPLPGSAQLLTLMAFGFGLDVIGLIGIILLIGIVKKNGIMLIDFALEAERTRSLTAEQSCIRSLQDPVSAHSYDDDVCGA